MEVSATPAQTKRSDRRRQVGAVTLAIVIAGVLAGVIAANDGSLPSAIPTVVPLPIAAWFGTVYAYTEVDSKGLRSRRWIEKHDVRWTHVAKITVERSSSNRSDWGKVTVHDAYSHRWHLGAPNLSGSDSADFHTEADRIVADCTTARSTGRGPDSYRLIRRRSPLFLIGMSVLAAAATAGWILLVAHSAPLDWKAHRGQGSYGTFTVTEVSCFKSCSSRGDFVSANATADRHGVLIDTMTANLSVGDRLPAINVDGGIHGLDGDGPVAIDGVSETVLASLATYAFTKLACDFLRRRRALRR